MALNPDKVADILQSDLNRYLRGYWTRNNFAERVEAMAMTPGTTAESFADWLILQVGTYIRPGFDTMQWKESLVQQLAHVEVPSNIPETIDGKTHKLLFIESIGRGGSDVLELLKTYARLWGVPTTEESFLHLDQAPTKPVHMLKLLRESTAAIVHDVDLENLRTIIQYISHENPGYAGRLIIVAKNSASPAHGMAYQVLQQLGAMIVWKPYRNFAEIGRKVFGITQKTR